MKRKREEPVSTLLMQFLREQGLETPLLEYRIIKAWSEVAGPTVSKYTGQLYIREGVLYVQIKSPSLRQNLSMYQSELTERLNNQVKSRVINSVRFF